MKFIKTLLILLISIMTSVQAQNKGLTLRDLVPGGENYSSFQPKFTTATAWWGDSFVYRDGDNMIGIDKPYLKDGAVILTLDDINNSLKEKNEKVLKGLPAFTFINDGANDKVRFSYNNSIYIFDYKSKSILSSIKYNDGDNSFDFNKDCTAFSVSSGNRLFVINSEGQREEISNDAGKDIVWGQSVHRNEFGINKGTFWSPKGNLLCFYRMDESMVGDYPLVDISEREAKANPIKYPMAGMASHQVTVGIYDLNKKTTVYIDSKGDKEHYYTNITWTPDEKYLLIAELNRDQNKMDLNKYDASTGKLVKTLFTETSKKYVEPQSPAFFVGDKGNFVWLSERDGYNHFYLYDGEGNLKKQITSGNWVVKNFVASDKKGENIFFVSNISSPVNQDLCMTNIKTGKTTLLTKDDGYHFTKLNGSLTAFYDRYSQKDIPGVEKLTNVKSLKSKTLSTSENPFKDYDMPEIELGTIKADDGTTDLYYRLTKPLNYSPDKKYPVIVYLYNGPHSQMVNNSFMTGVAGWHLYMAMKGYVVFTVDGRGTSFRGRDFEQATFHRLGEQEGKDQMRGIEFLKLLPYVDSERIGIHGWSFGGFMTTYMMCTYPETFKVGVAGGPVIDWKYYEIMYGERYMGHPEKNKEGYEFSNMLNRAKNLKGHLLMIHGDVDPVVVMQHSLSFLKKSVEVGVYPDYYIYPGHQHNVIGPDRVHLHEKITRYFDDYL
ncbi:MAG: DPP IV N-terminal domain-containing protein [Bacteroidales bacterium]|nr:DPP IV N-terminal domain-containing protein [Bacteroidales bacterium]